CERERGEFRAAAQIRSCLGGESGGLFESENEAVALMNVTDCPAVRNDITFEVPLVPQSVKKEMIGAGRFAAHGVVSAHDGIGVAFHDRSAKRRRVKVGEIARTNGHSEAKTQAPGAAVNGKVLGG